MDAAGLASHSRAARMIYEQCMSEKEMTKLLEVMKLRSLQRRRVFFWSHKKGHRVAEIEEYTYNPKNAHLHDSEASDKYVKEKKRHPGAIVTLDELDCRHWTVNVYATSSEKEEFLYNKMIGMVNKLLSVIHR